MTADQETVTNGGGGTRVRPRPGLRELKKAHTRAAILREAMRLFAEKGYQGTTVEEIAAAAEVTHTTVFRYFPTKEDLVLHDSHDEEILTALRVQPAGIPRSRLYAPRCARCSGTCLRSN